MKTENNYKNKRRGKRTRARKFLSNMNISKFWLLKLKEHIHVGKNLLL